MELKRVAEGDNLSVVFFVTTPKPSLPDALAPNTIVAVSLDPMQGFGDSTPKRPYAFGVILQCTPVPAGYNVTVKVVFKNDANLFHGERSTSRFSAVVSNHGAVYWLLPSTKLSTFSQELSSLDSLDKMDQVSLSKHMQIELLMMHCSGFSTSSWTHQAVRTLRANQHLRTSFLH